MIDLIRSEIEARIQAGHPAVILDALDALLAEIKISQEKCSYHTHFQSYWRLNSMMTHLTKMYYMDGISRDYSMVGRWTIDDGSAIAEIAQRLRNIGIVLEGIRPKRYMNVCRSCDACKTRRRRWPEHTTFAQPEAAIGLL